MPHPNTITCNSTKNTVSERGRSACRGGLESTIPGQRISRIRTTGKLRDPSARVGRCSCGMPAGWFRLARNGNCGRFTVHPPSESKTIGQSGNWRDTWGVSGCKYAENSRVRPVIGGFQAAKTSVEGGVSLSSAPILGISGFVSVRRGFHGVVGPFSGFENAVSGANSVGFTALLGSFSSF
jgi:hypothetical protein